MGQLLGNRYRFVKTLGSDLCGQTLLAEDIQLSGHPLRVVRRLILPNTGVRTLQFTLTLLRKKAESLKAICDHTQLPDILAFFEQNHTFFIIEEFVAGHPLTKELQSGKPLSEHQVIQLLQEVLEILIFIHSRGVIHRRLKPANLIRRQSDGRLVLSGFGIFKEISSQALRARTYPVDNLNGTLDIQPPSPPLPPIELNLYQAPEQALGQVHFNSDLYALGMIGIQAASGLSEEELGKLKKLNGFGLNPLIWNDLVQTSPELASILDRMVQLDSKQRYQLATHVLNDLTRLTTQHEEKVESPPAPAPPPSPFFGIKFPWKHPAISFGIAGLSITIGLIVLLRNWSPNTFLTQNLHQQAMVQEETGQYQQAIASYTEIINTRPHEGIAYYQRGLLHQRLGQAQNALADLTRAIELGSKVEEAYYQRGNLRFRLGDRSAAIEDYTQAIKLHPEYTRAYVNRGTVHAELGNDRQAIEDYTRAIQLDGKLAEAYLNRCLSQSNLGNHEAARSDCTQAISLKPDYTLAYQNRGLVNYRLKATQAALEDFKTAIRLSPRDADPYYNRGMLRAELGDRAGALSDFTDAIERNPRHALAYYDRAILYLESANRQAAKQDLQEAAKLCLDAGRVDCYKDAQFYLKQLEAENG
ncbi:MAG: tetratricopeptide repeat protein [Leptolyngbyaceae cyanobacterium bins.59]|nr:tetratricopeptide repeat protein [Leptolyngbyaceae cyanobacterium bins.59]